MQNTNVDSERQPAYGDWGVDLSAGDRNVAPGDDFFRFANGKWIDDYELPADRVRFGAFDALFDKSEAQVRALIGDLAENGVAPGSFAQKVRDLYLSYLDQDRIDARALGPIQGILAKIDAISSLDDLVVAFGRAGLDGVYSPIGWGVNADAKNPDRQLLTVGAGSLSLPDRDFYLQDVEQFKKIRSAFLEHIARMLAFVGQDAAEARVNAEAILALETRMAEAHWPRTELRDPDKTYNIYSYEKLREEFSDFDWARFFAEALLPKIDELNVATPSAVADIVKIIHETPLSIWRAHLTYKLLASTAELLSDDIAAAAFEFYGGVLNGQQERKPRWKRAIAKTSQMLGDAVGQLCVERHFPPEAKAEMDRLVANVMETFASRMETAPWMSDETRAMAKKKLATFLPKIGYPKKWKDYGTVTIDADDLFGNVQRAKRFHYDEAIRDLDKPTDRDKWFMTPQTVNAYYHPLFNEIVFPAAILQPPFFDPAADPAVNYGAIGAVIGHEMGHGFDDQGRKFDEKGVLRGWWAEDDIARFNEQAKKLVDQFNGYELLPGSYVNGELTLGENIGDLGGLTLGYHAYKLSLKGEEAPVIDGLTGDQRFFLSYAQIWRTKSRDEYALSRLKSDPHSPPVFRVNGALRNIDAWYDVFQIGPEAPWYLPPDQRARIW